MTNDELKEALFKKSPVVFESPSLGKIEYRCVSGIIYRERDGRLTVSVELLDKCLNSVTIADPAFVRLKEGMV